MQSSESKNWMPRQVANELSRGACNAHNTRERKKHPNANPLTGIVGDKTGMFVKEVKQPRVLNISER
jgi:hypothetical protein